MSLVQEPVLYLMLCFFFHAGASLVQSIRSNARVVCYSVTVLRGFECLTNKNFSPGALCHGNYIFFI